MEGRYFCSQTTHRLGMDAAARWPGAAPHLPWHLDLSGYSGSLAPSVIFGAFAQAWLWWAEIAEITPVMVQEVGEALVRKHFARIDGPNGVLAWSELADSTMRPKTQRYDNGEHWTVEWFLQAVACHEIGHVLGLEHDSQNSKALMAPFIQSDVRKPTDRDAARLLGLGYQRRTTPIPTDPQPGPVPPWTIRLAVPVVAGGPFTGVSGSALGIGDWRVMRADDGPPPVIPPG